MRYVWIFLAIVAVIFGAYFITDMVSERGDARVEMEMPDMDVEEGIAD